MKMLDYTDYAVFKRGPINKAMTVCATLDINVHANFEQTTRAIDEIEQPDYRLSKFACNLVVMNGDVKKKEVAKAQAYFTLGLYNMPINQLRECKGIPDGRSPLDFMGKEELAANLFRITQTEAKIRNEGVRGQKKLEDVAFSVGQQVRQTMEDISGTRPENLPIESDIKTVKSAIKSTEKEFLKLEKSKQPASEQLLPFKD